jgi:hypothetical protein
MANSFITNAYVKALAVKVFDSLNYLKNSTAPFDITAGMKPGSVYQLVIEDGGKPTDGLAITDADRTGLTERSIYAWIKSKKSVISASSLAQVVDMTSWISTISATAIKLAISIQQDVINSEYFKSGVVTVNSNPWISLADAASSVITARQGSQVTGYIAPRAQGSLAAKALGGYNFVMATDQGSKLYGQAMIGQYANVEYINIPEIPSVKAPATGISAMTVNSAVVINSTHFGKSVPETYLNIVGTANDTAVLPKGYTFNLPDIYSCNVQGEKSPYEFGFIVQEDTPLSGETAVNVKVQSLVTADCYARNCFVGDGTNSAENLAGVNGTAQLVLSAGVTYWPCEIRTKEALAFQGITLNDLEGAKNASEAVDQVKLQVASLGDFDSRDNYSRIDFSYVATKADIRDSAMAYIALT